MAGVINTTYTFTATDLVTSDKLNNLIDETIFTSDAITGTTLEVTGTGKLRVATGGVTSNELGAASVTNAKLATDSVGTVKIIDGSVTPAKLSTYAPEWGIADFQSGEGTAQATYTFSISPTRTADGAARLQFGAQIGANADAFINRASGANGVFSITNTGTGAMNITNGNALINFVVNGSTRLTLSGGSSTFTDTVVATSFVVSSDYRLKYNITPLDDQLAAVMALRPVSYTLSGSQRLGLIAHEVQEHFPEAVRGAKDAVKADGTPDYQAIEYTALIPVLLAAIQSQQRQLDELRSNR